MKKLNCLLYILTLQSFSSFHIIIHVAHSVNTAITQHVTSWPVPFNMGPYTQPPVPLWNHHTDFLLLPNTLLMSLAIDLDPL